MASSRRVTHIVPHDLLIKITVVTDTNHCNSIEEYHLDSGTKKLRSDDVIPSARRVQGANVTGSQKELTPVEYILSGVLKTKNWTLQQLESLKDAFSHVSEEWLNSTIVARIGKQNLVRLTFPTTEEDRDTVDLASLLVARGYAVPATFQQLKLAICDEYNPKVSPSSISPSVCGDPDGAVVIPAELPQLGLQSFPSSTLTVGSMHEVYISHIVDGMRSFWVQLKSQVNSVLIPLMVALNDDAPAEPFNDDVLVPGTICVGRYADDSLCRAVVESVLVNGANLFFVDFGNSHLVKWNEIYKLPSEFLRDNAMAIQYSLTGLSEDLELNSEEAAKIFHDLIMESSCQIIMEVTTPEEPSKQFCKLFLSINEVYVDIKNRVKDQMNVFVPRLKSGLVNKIQVDTECEVVKKKRVWCPAQYEQIPMKKNIKADVIISYIESPAQFFVQLSLNEVELDSITSAIEGSDKEVLRPDDVHENMSVCALYSEDHKWYRATVLNGPDQNGNVDVHFVDYGNGENVHCSKLRTISNRMISMSPAQAVQCLLNIDPKISLPDDFIALTTELLAGSEYAMNVLDVLPANILLVELFEKTTNQNMKDILMDHILPSLASNIKLCKNFRGQSEQQFVNRGKIYNSENWSRDPKSNKGQSDLKLHQNHLTRNQKFIGEMANSSGRDQQSINHSMSTVKNRGRSDGKCSADGNGNSNQQSNYNPDHRRTTTGQYSSQADNSFNCDRGTDDQLSLNQWTGNPKSHYFQGKSQHTYEWGAVFKEPDYKPGQTLEVRIFGYENPTHFHAAPIAMNNDFHILQQTLQTHYLNHKPLDVRTLLPYDCVVARNKDNNIIYRARFLCLISDGALVNCVDYGLNAKVKANEVWAVSQQHCKIPTRAFCCRLANISTIDEKAEWWMKKDIQKYFVEEKYKMTFLQCLYKKSDVCRTWPVSLANDFGRDIGVMKAMSLGFTAGRKLRDVI